MQVLTLLADLDDEIQTGQYINSAGQPEAAETINAVPAAATWTTTATPPSTPGGHVTSSVHSSSSYPSQPFLRHVFAPQHDAAVAQQMSEPPPPRMSRMHATALPRPPKAGASRASRSGSKQVAAEYSAAAAAVLGRRARSRMHSQPLARPHRAAVRAVISMPCDPIPEDERSEFPMLPPFVSAQSLSPPNHVSDGGAAPAVDDAADAAAASAAAAAPVMWATSSAYDEAPSTGSDSSGPGDSGREERAQGGDPAPAAAGGGGGVAEVPMPPEPSVHSADADHAIAVSLTEARTSTHERPEASGGPTAPADAAGTHEASQPGASAASMAGLADEIMLGELPAEGEGDNA